MTPIPPSSPIPPSPPQQPLPVPRKPMMLLTDQSGTPGNEDQTGNGEDMPTKKRRTTAACGRGKHGKGSGH